VHIARAHAPYGLRPGFEQAALSIASDLDDLELSFALIGGFAVSIRTDPRFTQDIDLVVSIADDKAAELAVNRLVARGYAILATVSGAQRPHSAGILYQAVGTTLYVNTHRQSRKARNVAANPHIGLTIPGRRLPVGPPSAVQFQGTAEVLALDDPQVTRLVQGGELKKITSHGELDDPGHCFLRITPDRKVHTYGLGMSLWQLLKNPLGAAGQLRLPNET
jgi:general stress protein 26